MGRWWKGKLGLEKKKEYKKRKKEKRKRRKEKELWKETSK